MKSMKLGTTIFLERPDEVPIFWNGLMKFQFSGTA